MGLRNKRLTAAVIAVFTSSAVFASLATPAHAAKTLNIISLYKTSGGVEKDAMKLLISKFEAASGAIVKFTEAADVATQYNSDLLAGKGADIMIVNLFDQTNAWLENGASVPVGDYIKQWGLNKVISAGGIADWTDKTGSGAVQGFPFAGFTWPVWYNKSLLAKAGIKTVPQTTDQLITAAKALKAKGIAPIVVGGSDWSGNKFWSQIVETYMSPKEAKKVFSTGGYCASKNAMKGINLFVKMRNAGVFVKGVEGYTADQMNTAYYTGKAAIIAAGSWAMPGTPAKIAAVTEMGGLPVPPGAHYKKPTAFQAYSAVGVFVGPAGVAKLPLVKQFITALYSAEVIAKFVSDVAIIPATKTPLTASSLASASPLLAQSVTKLPSKVEYALFPDNYVAAKGSGLEKASALAYGPGVKSSAICKAADNAYKD
jgi:multiple sugar transport system substrate-binding protein